ncbi:hypothetical protein HK101_009249 [Irineochytrium annulatum]|nr:hypothetical protein HK101_009249 [Irineochytrium annulatum]
MEAAMNRILAAVRNHTDKGRRICELFLELVDRNEYPDYYQVIKHPVAIETIQAKIDKGEYGDSFSRFEADFNQMISNATAYNRNGSEVYRDALTLKSVFEVNLGKETKAIEARLRKEALESQTPVESFEKDGITYKAGDFVYIINPNEPAKPTIAQIGSMFSSGRHTSFTANWFLRPEQTVHKATSRFMENEVLKSNRSETYSSDDIEGQCWVLFVKDYVRGKPKGADQRHVYVCESRYNVEGKASQRIKLWHMKCSDEDLDLFETPMVPNKVNSVFAEAETHVKKKVEEEPSKLPPRDVSPKKESRPVPIKAPQPEQKIRLTMKAATPDIPSPAPAPRIQMPDKRPTALRPPQSVEPPRRKNPGSKPAPPISTVFTCSPDDGHLKWFPTPPVDVAARGGPYHTLEYLVAYHTKRGLKREHPEAHVAIVEERKRAAMSCMVDSMSRSLEGLAHFLFESAT